MLKDFNTVMPPAAPMTKEDYSLTPSHQAKWGVLEILPIKSEVEALPEHDGTVDVRKLVPWKEGIVLRLIALKTRQILDDGKSIVRDLFTMDPNGKVALVYNGKYMGQWCKLDRGEVERGWARQYNREKRKLVYEFPENWDSMRPAERYAYWLNMIGGRFGFPVGSLQEGSTFYGYFTRSKSKTTDKWYSDVKKLYKDNDDNWHDACPTELGTVDVSVLRQLSELIKEDYEQRAPTSFNFGANTKPSGGSELKSFDEEAGF